MAVRVVSRSHLRFGELKLVDEVEFWDTVDLPEIPVQFDDLEYQVKGHDRIDLVAWRFYGDPVLWWVIAVANDMEILPTDLNRYEIIRIPSPRYVLQELFLGAQIRR